MADQILFKFKEYVQLWRTNNNVPNINGPMIQYDTKIYKGATNTIDFVVRNNDRKPVSLVGFQIDALIQRVDDPELLLIKQVYPTDETIGRARLTLASEDIDEWPSSFYKYTIRLTDITGRQEFLYTDVNRSTFGSFELIEGIKLSLVPPQIINSSSFTPYPYGYYENTWATGALAGDAQTNQVNGVHTFVAYTSNNFIGEFWIQGSLTTTAPLETDWFNIPLKTGPTFKYTETDSPKIKVFNIIGNYYWLRAFYKISPINKSGIFDKIFYKN